jgi:hypothetical protein
LVSREGIKGEFAREPFREGLPREAEARRMFREGLPREAEACRMFREGLPREAEARRMFREGLPREAEARRISGTGGVAFCVRLNIARELSGNQGYG